MMKQMKRMTLRLHETRLAELKKLATERGYTLSALVDELLADGIRRARKRRTVRLPVFEMGKARVDIADREQLCEIMEQDDASRFA
jgi:predicted DNA-binding ribbon-helix-helix protein